jgi:hypothetical protein
VQRGPLKKAGLIEQQADNDDRNERARGVPDNLPDHRISPMYAGQQRQRRTDDGTPANAQPFGCQMTSTSVRMKIAPARKGSSQKTENKAR